MKKCSKCGQEKLLDEFYLRHSTGTAYGSQCKVCTRETTREWHKNNKDRVRERRKTNHWKLQRRRQHLAKYGLTLETYANMLTEQSGVCAICKTSDWGGTHKVPAIDHNHSTNQVRQLLCHSCNRGIGWMREEPAFLREAANYLERWNTS